MHFSRNIISCLLGLVLSPVLASFEREIVRRSTSHHRRSSHRLNDALLDVAIPLAEYEKQTGFTLNNRNLQQNGDDFGVLDSGDSYSFTGYSLKYMQCQAVQYFSENALQSGEASPMVTQDIVILRLCPQKSCLSSESKGCHYNYADFALTLSEYLGIMLKYSAYKRDANCEWCTTCIENDSQHRRLANDDAAANQAANGDDAAAGAGANQAAANGDDAASANQAVQGDDAAKGQHDDAAKADDYVAVDDKYVYKGSCANFDTYCTNYTTDCQQDDNSYLDFEGYLDYIDCTQVKYNGYPYYVRPRCDASSGSIKMAVYYDNYCAKTAGSDISVKNLGLGFKDGVFENYYSSQCTDCSESENPPYFAANSLLCSKVHVHSATCTEHMMYDLFQSEANKSTDCSYIASIRNGAYDEYGQFSSKSGGGSSWDASMTTAQGVVLGAAIAACVFFIIFACYLHHSMTNLLLKSLSHRELLPRKTRSRSRTSREGSNSRRSAKVGDEADWEGLVIA